MKLDVKVLISKLEETFAVLSIEEGAVSADILYECCLRVLSWLHKISMCTLKNL